MRFQSFIIVVLICSSMQVNLQYQSQLVNGQNDSNLEGYQFSEVIFDKKQFNEQQEQKNQQNQQDPQIQLKNEEFKQFQDEIRNNMILLQKQLQTMSERIEKIQETQLNKNEVSQGTQTEEIKSDNIISQNENQSQNMIIQEKNDVLNKNPLRMMQKRFKSNNNQAPKGKTPPATPPTAPVAPAAPATPATPAATNQTQAIVTQLISAQSIPDISQIQQYNLTKTNPLISTPQVPSSVPNPTGYGKVPKIVSSIKQQYYYYESPDITIVADDKSNQPPTPAPVKPVTPVAPVTPAANTVSASRSKSLKESNCCSSLDQSCCASQQNIDI